MLLTLKKIIISPKSDKILDYHPNHAKNYINEKYIYYEEHIPNNKYTTLGCQLEGGKNEKRKNRQKIR